MAIQENENTNPQDVVSPTTESADILAVTPMAETDVQQPSADLTLPEQSLPTDSIADAFVVTQPESTEEAEGPLDAPAAEVAAAVPVIHYESSEEAEGISEEPVAEPALADQAVAADPMADSDFALTDPAPDVISEMESPAQELPISTDDLPADAEVPETTITQSSEIETTEAVTVDDAIPTADGVTTDSDMDTDVPVVRDQPESTEEAEGMADATTEESVEEYAPVDEAVSAETDEQQDLDRKSEALLSVVEEPTETDDETPVQPTVDYSSFTKQDFVALLDQQAEALQSATVNPGDFKRADQILKDVKPLFDTLKRAERAESLQKFIAETGSEEGFEFRTDDSVLRFENQYKQIKSQKNQYFQNLDKAKDTNFSTKTDLLQRLRQLVESGEENAGDPKVSWTGFKAIQDEWKAAGNMNSPHNATLWATYHALVDRYYSNRNIYFELKELDRKRNISLKTEVIEKVEALAATLTEKAVTRQTIEEANALFEEYKHIGPAPKAEQEVLWQRIKAALDIVYDKRRGQNDEQRKESAQVYDEKSKLYEEFLPLTTFTSGSINDWNEKTKETMGFQDRWNAIKGPMPREEGKELSKKFWAALKVFFANKSEFFRQLEGKREQNLKLKVELCEQVEAILTSGDETSESTNRVIELQREWKNVGQVPEKQKNTIFERFKAACDAFFDKKRSKNQETDREFEDNLAQKNALIERIEAAALTGANLNQLNDFKADWAAIGFVPKKDMQMIQKRYIAAVNALVGANAKLSPKEKETAIKENEAEFSRGPARGGSSGGGGGDRGPRRDGGGGRDGNRDRGDRSGGRDRDNDGGDFNAYRRSTEGSGPGGDLRRKITALENDIATYNNNIEFFGRSKNADKFRADIEQKIAAAQQQVNELKKQLSEAA
jgi:hypothetical protein